MSAPLDPDAIRASWGADGPVVDLVDETDLVLVPAPEDEDGVPVRALFEQRLQARIGNADDPEERELLRHALRHATEAGFEKARLDTIRNTGPAVRLFERHGFVEIPRYNDNRYADLFMELSLSIR